MAESPPGDGYASQRVIAVGIETGRDKHDVGLEKIGYRSERLLESEDVTVIVHPSGHGNIVVDIGDVPVSRHSRRHTENPAVVDGGKHGIGVCQALRVLRMVLVRDVLEIQGILNDTDHAFRLRPPVCPSTLIRPRPD